MIDLVVVDDEELEREGLVSFIPFDSLGIRVAGTACNGREGLDLIMRASPAIVITDIRMPMMNGIDMIRAAKEAHSDAVFVVLSGYGDFEYTSQAMELGIRHYLLKPVDDEKILDVMRQVLEEIGAARTVREELEEASHLRNLLGESLLMGVSDALGASKEELRANQAQQTFDDLLGGHLESKGYETVCLSCFVANLKLRYLDFSVEDRATLFSWVFRENEIGTDLAAFYAVHDDTSLLEVAISTLADGLLPSTARGREQDERLLRTLFEHLTDQDLSARALAQDVLYMNADHFGRRLKALTGQSFPSFVNEMRIEAAKQLLALAPDEKLSVIAETVGFASDEQYFSRVFRKLTGMRPRDYANSCQH